MDSAPDEKVQEVLSWQKLIITELHIALCGNRGRYRKEVSALKTNAKLLIAGIAGYVAKALGVSVAVIAAMVASLLHLAISMGVSAFCKKYT